MTAANVFLPAFLWYLAASLIGLATLPLVYRFLPALPGRGYAFTRTAGLLVWGYILWLLSSLGVLQNDLGGIVFAFGLLAGLAIWAFTGIPQGELRTWLRENGKLILQVEVLFAAAFFGYALFRALAPEIIATEKPMELAFINSILRSPSMPPRDPWLADYAISYYYFGYVIVGMLAKVTGVNGGVAFNLGITLVFSLTAIGAYGVLYDLLAAFRDETSRLNRQLALLGPLYVLIVSNVEGFLELLYSYQIFWTQSATGEWVSSFWQWLGIKSLVDAPNPNAVLGERRFWWWWRASRVVQDYKLVKDDLGAYIPDEVIDEFPFFSFYLADLHPHVLAMPFIMLAVALALHLYLKREPGKMRLLMVEVDLGPEIFFPAGLILGGLAFMNIWDFPMYVGFFSLVYAYKAIRRAGWDWERLWEFLILGVSLGVVGFGLYLPFYISFSSQAGGILPNLYNPTRGAQLWVMFGTLFVPIFLYLAYQVWGGPQRKMMRKGITASVGFSLLLAVLGLAAGWLATLLPGGEYLLNSLGLQTWGEVLAISLERRWAYIGGWITLTVLFGLALAGLWPARNQEEDDEETPSKSGFPLLMIVFGSILVITPEFIYLRDLFGTRMNTVFKFYIQAWLVWGLAAAYASAILLSETKRRGRYLSGAILLVVLAVGLTYPALGFADRIRDYRASEAESMTLDGADHFSYLDVDDHAAVAWLLQAPLGTLVEAVGGSYSDYARISTHSGQPALLGWPGHESQWRGGGEEMGSRFSDIERLYATGSWREAELIIRDYGIRYIYVGALEFRTYDVRDGKFQEFLIVAFQQGGVVIYEAPEGILLSEK